MAETARRPPGDAPLRTQFQQLLGCPSTVTQNRVVSSMLP